MRSKSKSRVIVRPSNFEMEEFDLKSLLRSVNEVYSALLVSDKGSKSLPQVVGSPAMNSTFFYIDSAGQIKSEKWSGNHGQRLKLQYGNVFRTRDHAKSVSQILTRIIHQHRWMYEFLGSGFVV